MPSTGVIRWPTDGLILCPGKNLLPSHMQHSSKIVPKVLAQQIKALLTDGLLSAFPAADACPADLCVVGKLLTAPAFGFPVASEQLSAAPVQKQGVVVQNILHRDTVKGSELVRNLRGEAPAEIAAFKVLVEPFFYADHGGNVFLQQAETVSAPAHTVGRIGDFGVGMVHTEERLCFRSGVRPGKRHLQDVERG